MPLSHSSNCRRVLYRDPPTDLKPGNAKRAGEHPLPRGEARCICSLRSLSFQRLQLSALGESWGGEWEHGALATFFFLSIHGNPAMASLTPITARNLAGWEGVPAGGRQACKCAGPGRPCPDKPGPSLEALLGGGSGAPRESRSLRPTWHTISPSQKSSM